MYRFLSVVLVLSGCSFLASNGLSLDYSFDTLDFQQKFETAPGTIPSIPCSSNQDAACAALATLIDSPDVTVSCDATSHCAASVDVRLSYTINLSEQKSFPPEALEYGVRAVTLSKIAYWLRQNTLTVAIPSVDLFVGPETAVDERDERTHKLGTLASIAAKSVACADPVDPKPDSAAGGAMVCKLPLLDEGRAALQTLAADYKTPFKLLVHGVTTVKAGDPIPSGTIAFSVKPTVSLAVSTSL